MEYISDQTFDHQDFTISAIAHREFESCTFRNCNFSGCDLSKLRFISGEFVDCNLSNIIVHDTAFQDVMFKHCKMLGIHFPSCNTFNLSMQFEDCVLSHSIFFQMNLSKCSFFASLLDDVDFTESNLSKVSLKECNLVNAVFDSTNLTAADLQHSIHYTIDPDNNNIKGAKFSLPDVMRLLDKYGVIIS